MLVKAKYDACKRLIKSCHEEMLNNEYRIFTVRGVSNLTVDDLETIIMYCEYFIENKTIGGLMPPRGDVATILRKINLC